MPEWNELFKKQGKCEAEIMGFQGDEILRERFFEMGLLLGAHLRILGKAPFHGPWIIQLNTTLLALRDEEAQCLKLKFLRSL